LIVDSHPSDDDFVKIIVEAIRKIKSHKQKPDKDRICTYIQQQRPHITKDTVFRELGNAVVNGHLLTTQTRGADKMTYVEVLNGTPTTKAHSSSQSDSITLISSSDTKIIVSDRSDISKLMVQAVRGRSSN